MASFYAVAAFYATPGAKAPLQIFPAPVLASEVAGSDKGFSLLTAHHSLNRNLSVNCSSNPKESALAEGVIKTRLLCIRESAKQKGHGGG